jgi:hypothetical protein
VHCPDNPRLLLEQRLCVSAVSKDLRGELGEPGRQRWQCEEPRCLTLTTRQALKLEVAANQLGCDVQRPGDLEGVLAVAALPAVHAPAAGRPSAAPRRRPGGVSGAQVAGLVHRPLNPLRGVQVRCGSGGFPSWAMPPLGPSRR